MANELIKCSVVNCENTDNDDFLKFYSLPYKNKELCKEWIIRIGNPLLYIQHKDQPIPSHKICEIHFHYSCKTKEHSQLHPLSVPTLHIPLIKGKKTSMNCFFEPSESTSTTGKSEITTSERIENPFKVEVCKEICQFCFRRGILYDINESMYDKNVKLEAIIKYLVPEYDLEVHTDLLESICLDCVKQIIISYITVKQIRCAFNIFSAIFETPVNAKNGFINIPYPDKIDIKSILNDCVLNISLVGSLSYLPDSIKASVKKKQTVSSNELPMPVVLKVESENLTKTLTDTKKQLTADTTTPTSCSSVNLPIDQSDRNKYCIDASVKKKIKPTKLKAKQKMIKLGSGSKLFKHLLKVGHVSDTSKIMLTKKQFAELTTLSKSKQGLQIASTSNLQTAPNASTTKVTDMSNKPSSSRDNTPIRVTITPNTLKQYGNRRKKIIDAKKNEIGHKANILLKHSEVVSDESEVKYCDFAESDIDFKCEDYNVDEEQIETSAYEFKMRLDSDGNTDGAMCDNSQLFDGALENIDAVKIETDSNEIVFNVEGEARREECKKEFDVNKKEQYIASTRLYVCNIQNCTFKGSSLQEYADHITKFKHKLLKEYNCQYCDFTCTEIPRYSLHLKTHKDEEMNKKRKEKDKLQDEGMNKNRKEKDKLQESFQCAKCGRILTKKSAFLKHMQKFHAPSACPSCDKEGKPCASHNRAAIMRQFRFEKNRRCDDCNITFESVRLCTRHIMDKHPNICLICYRKFARLSVLRKHIQHHKDMTAKEEFECDLCHRKFKHFGALSVHLKCQAVKGKCAEPIRPPRPLCTICGKKIVNHVTHMLSHTKEKYYKCEYCSYETEQKHNMDRHIMVHTGFKPFLCTDCGQSFNQKAILDLHMKQHTVLPQPVDCKYCVKIFNTKYELNVHLQSHGINAFHRGKYGLVTADNDISVPREGVVYKPRRRRLVSANDTTSIPVKNVVKRRYSCVPCNRTFQSAWLLKVHTIELHEKIKGFFKCRLCREEFNTYNIMRMHLIIEHKRRDFLTCKICNKVCGGVAHLKIHVNSHSKKRPFKCPLCPSMFKQKGHVEIHKKAVHEDKRPFPCKSCDKAFRSKPSLAEHIRTHTGERLECDYCDKTFAGRSNKCKHMREVHNIRRKTLENVD